MPGCRSDGLEVLRCLGGREIAAMAAAILRARHLRIPVILDGFICTRRRRLLEVPGGGRSITLLPVISVPKPRTASCCEK